MAKHSDIPFPPTPEPRVEDPTTDLRPGMQSSGLASEEANHRRDSREEQHSYGPLHPELAASLDNLARVIRDQGRFEEAEPLFRQALSVWEKSLGREHPEGAFALNNLPLLYTDMGRHSEAVEPVQRALSIRIATLGEDHPDTATTRDALARLIPAKTGKAKSP